MKLKKINKMLMLEKQNLISEIYINIIFNII